jgi:hypothetical protein
VEDQVLSDLIAIIMKLRVADNVNYWVWMQMENINNLLNQEMIKIRKVQCNVNKLSNVHLPVVIQTLKRETS